jgi:hypothetical protein
VSIVVASSLCKNKIKIKRTMKLLQKKSCFSGDFERLPYTYIQKNLLGEVVLGLLNFILTFFVLLIRNNLLELIQGNHADGLNVEKVMNQ